MSDTKIRVMLVDDAAVIRGLVKRMIEPEEDVEIVASVANGEQAIKSLKIKSVDVIVLDIEMPVMDGLTALPQLLEIDPDVNILMSSTLTLGNAEISMMALKLGAADYIPKPTSAGEMGSASEFRRELVEKIKCLGGTKKRPSSVVKPGVGVARKGVAKKPLYTDPVTLRPITTRFRPEIIAIGSSTGGPKALFELLKNIRSDVKIPIIISQHMPPNFTTILANHIASSSGRPTQEAKDGDTLVPGEIYVAPGGYHMLVEKAGVKTILRTTQDPPENYCRPAVDPMFRSVASVYGARALGVILTGMGNDGSKGGKILADAGSTIIAQDEETSVVWGMPGAAATSGICSAVLPLEGMAPYISDFLLKGAA